MVVMISINVYLLAEKGLDVSRGLFFNYTFLERMYHTNNNKT